MSILFLRDLSSAVDVVIICVQQTPVSSVSPRLGRQVHVREYCCPEGFVAGLARGIVHGDRILRSPCLHFCGAERVVRPDLAYIDYLIGMKTVHNEM